MNLRFYEVNMFFKKEKKEEKCILTLKRYKYAFTVKDGGRYENETNWIVGNKVENPSSFVLDCFMQEGYIFCKKYYPMHNVTCVEINLSEEKMICVLKKNSFYRVLTDKQVDEISIDE